MKWHKLLGYFLKVACFLLPSVLAHADIQSVEELPGWFDTAEHNSLDEDPAAFAVEAFQGATVLRAVSPAYDTHSHFMGNQIQGPACEYSGRMYQGEGSEALGVTFASDYPNSDTYYKLITMWGEQFRLAAHPYPEKTLPGYLNTWLQPQAGSWYRFRMQWQHTAAASFIRAKIWVDGEAEPNLWQIHAEDAEANRPQNCRVGVWSMGSNGNNFWDQLSVKQLTKLEPDPEIAGEGMEAYGHSWVETREADGDLLAPSEGQFYVSGLPGNDNDAALVNITAGAEVHHHLIGSLPNYHICEFSGDMRKTQEGSQFGITFASGFPHRDTYYGIRSDASDPSFHLVVHPTTGKALPPGPKQTGVIPALHTPYQFRVQWEDKGTSTRIRAKVWDAANPEPETWQIQVEDSDPDHYTACRIGVWSSGAAENFWNNLSLHEGDPKYADFDDDGLRDHVDPDQDNDSFSNIAEWRAGSKPRGKTSTPQNIQVPPYTELLNLPSVQDAGFETAHWQAGGTTSDHLLRMGVYDDGSGLEPIHAGFRFVLPLSPTVGLKSAKLLLYAAGEQTGTPQLKLWADASDDCAAFADALPIERTGTTAIAKVELFEGQWDAAGWVAVDVGDIVNEIILRQNWESGNHICLIASGVAGVAPADVVVAGPSHPSGNAPQLVVQYERQTADWDNDGVLNGLDEFPRDRSRYTQIQPQTITLLETLGGWLDTGERSSLEEDAAAFVTEIYQGGTVLRAVNPAYDTHSHFMGGQVQGPACEYSGRMNQGDGSEALGATFSSDYPNSDTYYKLLSVWGDQFRLWAHPYHEKAVYGYLNTWVRPTTNSWYRFRMQWQHSAAVSFIRAKVWLDGEAEPDLWQIHAEDAQANRPQNCRVGVWSMGSNGNNFWDQLTVKHIPQLEPDPEIAGEGVEAYGHSWVQTRETDGDPLAPSEGQFYVSGLPGNDNDAALLNITDGAEVHHHLIGSLPNYHICEFSGDMRKTQEGSQFGITFASGFPHRDTYYGIRSDASDPSFHLVVHPTTGKALPPGPKQTGVIPALHTPYQFRVQWEDKGTSTRIRAKVWNAANPEPENWQIQVEDSDPDHYTACRVGVWTSGAAENFWNNLSLHEGDPDFLDSDGDGVPNVDDPFPNDPAESSDIDGDGIGDNADTDRDGDGFSNDEEIAGGSDPNSATDVPDRVAPSLAVFAQSPQTINANTVVLTGSVSDPVQPHSGVRQVQVMSDRLGSLVLTATVTGNQFSVEVPLKVELNTLTLTATDLTGNSRNITHVVDRISPPHFTNVTPVSGSLVTTDKVILKGQVHTLLPLSDVSFSVNEWQITPVATPPGHEAGQPGGAQEGVYYFQLDDVPLVLGENRFELKAQTSDGTEQQLLILNHRPDNASELPAPVISIRSPASGSILNQSTFVLGASIVSAGGPVAVYVDGQLVVPATTDLTTVELQHLLAFSGDASTLSVPITAVDSLEHSTTVTATFHRDQQEPQIVVEGGLLPVPHDNRINDSRYVFTGTVTDSNLANFLVNDQPLVLEPTATVGQYRFRVNLQLVAGIPRTVNLQARDISGNLRQLEYQLTSEQSAGIDPLLPGEGTELLTTGTPVSVQVAARTTALSSGDSVVATVGGATPSVLTLAGTLAAGTVQLPAAAGEYQIEYRVLNASSQTIATNYRRVLVRNKATVPMQVERIEPANNATLIEPNSPLEVHFNQALDLSKLQVSVRETLHGHTYINRDASGLDFLQAKGFTLEEVHRDLESVPGSVSVLPGQTSVAFYADRLLGFNSDIFITVEYDGTVLERSRFKVRPLPTYINGMVRDQFGQPLSGVQVSLPTLGRTTTTNGDGGFAFGYQETGEERIVGGRYRILVNNEMTSPTFGTLIQTVNLQEGRRNDVGVFVLQELDGSLPFEQVKGGNVNSLAKGELTLDLTQAQLAFPNGRDYGALKTQFLPFGQFSVNSVPGATPLWLFALQPRGVEVQGSAGLQISIPALKGSHEYMQGPTTHVLLLGYNPEREVMEPVGIGRIDGLRVISEGEVQLQSLDYLGYAFVDPVHNASMQAVVAGTKTLQQLMSELQ